MNYGGDSLSPSDVALLTSRNGGGNGGNGWGDSSGWWIILFLLVLFGGWGNGNWGGNNGGNGGGYATFMPYGIPYSAPASQTNLTDAFNFNTLSGDTRAIQSSLCSGFAGVTNAINDASRASLECCCNTRSDIAQQGFNTVTAINATGSNLGMGMINGFNEVNRGIQQNGFNTQECLKRIKEFFSRLFFNQAVGTYA